MKTGMVTVGKFKPNPATEEMSTRQNDLLNILVDLVNDVYI